MSSKETDLTFFTNDENGTLLDRFKATLDSVNVVRTIRKALKK